MLDGGSAYMVALGGCLLLVGAAALVAALLLLPILLAVLFLPWPAAGIMGGLWPYACGHVPAVKDLANKLRLGWGRLP